jgi:hypothetical protein
VVSGTGSVTPGIVDVLRFIPRSAESLGQPVETVPDSLATDAGRERAPPSS